MRTNLKEISYGTKEHQETISLRNKLLRDPIGLLFTDKDLQEEEEVWHIACYLQSNEMLVGCCFLSPYINSNTIKLRQMAVDNNYQKKGIGTKLIRFAENIAKEKGYKYMHLHARKEAVGFYQKQGYTVEGEEFREVGIPHLEMLKELIK